MQISAEKTNIEKEAQSCLIIPVHEKKDLLPTAKKLDQQSHGWISELIKQERFSGKKGEILPLFSLPHTNYTCVILVGAGQATTLSPTTFRKIVSEASKTVNALKVKKVISYLTELSVENRSITWLIKHLTEVTHESLYQFDIFKTEKKPRPQLQTLTLHLPETTANQNIQQAIAEGSAVAEGVFLAKQLANLPSNICTPSFLADQALELANEHSTLKVKILDEKEMHKLGMGALLGVAQGSAEEAKLICIEYKPPGKKKAPVAFIGKGITFDTGGNSIKPADSMVGMKYDMCGAAAVLGVLKAAAMLKLPTPAVGIIAAVENMPGGTAYKPEDILTSLSKQTIEVISTDAEGRLVLADALTYCERYNPDVVIDIATLTGAVVIALGHHASGLMTNHEALAQDLLKAGLDSHDRAWQLPLWDEYQEQIKSPFADMANTGGRSAGTITAACFLSRFAKKFRWAHLDVAGTAAMMMGTQERMATGRPVPLLLQYLINRSS